LGDERKDGAPPFVRTCFAHLFEIAFKSALLLAAIT